MGSRVASVGAMPGEGGSVDTSRVRHAAAGGWHRLTQVSFDCNYFLDIPISLRLVCAG